MSDALLIRLGPNDPTHEQDLSLEFGLDANHIINLVDVATPSGTFSQLKRQRVERVILPNSKPERACKFVPLLLWLIAARPREIVVAGRKQEQRRSSLSSFISASLPAVAAQILGAPLTLVVHALSLTALQPRMSRRRILESPKRILYVRSVAGYLADVGGSVTHANEVINGLRSIGCEVEVREAVLAGSNPPSDPRHVRWSVQLFSRLLPGFVAMGGDLVILWHSLRMTRGCDAIYQRLNPCSAAGLLLSALTRSPLIVEYNSTIEHDGTQALLGRYQRYVEKLNLRFASRIIVISQVLIDDLVRSGVDEERLVLNPNAVDPSRFKDEGSAQRISLGFDDSEVVFCFVGSFGFWHGAPVLARAFSKVADEFSRARLLMVGDGIERSETELILADSGCSDQVIFLGSVDIERVPSLLESADVLCSPHVPWPNGLPFHGSPTKLFEYMAAGRAIVASSLGQIAEVLENEVSAILVTPGDVDSLAEAMVRLLRDPALRTSLGAAALAEVHRSHTWEINAERIVSADVVSP